MNVQTFFLKKSIFTLRKGSNLGSLKPIAQVSVNGATETFGCVEGFIGHALSKHARRKGKSGASPYLGK